MVDECPPGHETEILTLEDTLCWLQGLCSIQSGRAMTLTSVLYLDTALAC